MSFTLPNYSTWVRQREQCRTCKHIQENGRGMLSCVAVKGSRGGQGADSGKTCIRMREQGAACGPDGLLFEAKG